MTTNPIRHPGATSTSAAPEDGSAPPAAGTPADAWVATLHDTPATVDAAAWDALLEASAEPTPFLRHAFLAALHDSGSACTDTGWQPLLLTLERPGEADQAPTLAAACALYLKHHSRGEYVFDWAWADAYQRAGHAYYPKLLAAVPFTPVPGTRLLARDEAARQALLHTLERLMRGNGLSSAHLLFLAEADRAAAVSAGWLMRCTVQFHWSNRDVQQPGSAPWPDFEHYLAGLQRDKRKKIQQERRRVRDAGVQVRALRGREITPADWDFFYRCYVRTYREHGNPPYLSRDFFARVARDLPEHWLLFVAERSGAPIAASLIALDPARRIAYGRYWGALEPVPCLHFECCYYQPLAWCIAQGWRRFEGGAQGEHKMARGLLPVATWSAHKLAHPGFEDAVERYLEREGAGMADYLAELEAHAPFKAPPADPA